MTHLAPGYVLRREGERRDFAGGGIHEWMARSEETGGAFHAFIDHLVAGKRTPLHLHPEADDSMYVIDGELRFYVDGEVHELGPGSFVTALRGTPHAFMVTSETATVFAFQTPGVGESFYRDASDPRDPAAVGAKPEDIPRLQRTAAANEVAVTILGPPPFDAD
ncbi:MAG: cupin domain-containing protein [Frankiaceae bacterium]|nr:cupin domain-containing protein [Frankiaceae bacterium]MBV9870320.1 cupin domain-containing protein [Frankiaceae bacterium]